ncbi:tRNA-specific 2-thiouridylase MnmA [Microbacterium hydrocarbonoxydans]|jgi:tRNA-specific 2-thiouridylase|uniref:tRNA-specific 2-thiouridylase MnmA n=1 Tax=Microbacterium hydrocarbonoxydans TaxID=273678 RepID=A0A0M2HID5_9MICO|nr:tRNA 2-thiouridine(34) synthase MnmA [Microbacterium hydrocarbonoxydans]KJL46474.1 tRNA-specific 2-thiouridylase MnmA [Microbacterium hydrocarbonoxydans]
MRILAAMSGGVDSAVAAARAVDAGHDVVGVHLALSRAGGTLRTGSRGCCTIEDALDARRAADLLGIPFYVWDFSERFRDDVIADFVSEYQAGRTPNPCMRCNEKIKFAALLERALELGFDAVCTGHYANLVSTETGLELHRAADDAKDQSYVLGVLTAEQLAHTYFPLGSTPSKALVRAEAAERGLSVAQKPDSHDICFIPDGDTRGWLAEKVGSETGDIVDRSGAVVGTHEGAHSFTVGQRRGLKLGVPASDGKPRFVLEVRPVSNTVVVGPKEALAVREISGTRFSWAGAAPTADEFACEVQIRAHAEPVPASATVTADGVVVVPEVSLDGVATGQTAVLYVGTRVLGQFTIDRTVSAVPVDA